MKKDQRYKFFISSLSILLIMFLVHVLNQLISAEALFGITGKNLSQVLAFNTNTPMKFGGGSLITSYFVHYNWSHLVQDLFLLGFFSMLLEKTMGSIRVVFYPILTHIFSLIPLSLIIDGEHLFLGSSLGGIFLFVYFCLIQKKPILLSIGLILIVGIGFFNQVDLYGTMAHGFAILISFFIYFVTKHRLPRPKEA